MAAIIDDKETDDVKIRNNSLNKFQNTRCIVAISKNNNLRWISDWVEFYVKIHKADAVLVYDNNSDAYSPEDILETILSVHGVNAAGVVVWPYKFGPGVNPAGGHWDSDFCQYGMLTHARYRFLARARSVLNVDIDEFVVSDRSIFDLAEESREGSVMFPGRWIMNSTRKIREDLPRHRDFVYYDPTKGASPNKWCAVPSRIGASTQWLVHSIRGSALPPDVMHRHFQGITTGWKHPRGAIDFDETSFRVDEQLARVFAKL